MAGISRREFERRQANQEWMERQLAPATPSDTIEWLETLRDRPPLIPVVLWVRVSSDLQRSAGNLKDQERWCKRRLALWGFRVIKTFRATGSGKLRDDEIATKQLRAAARYALVHGAILVTESVSRFVRNQLYSPLRPTPPLAVDMERLVEITDGVRLATILNPDLEQEEERGEQTKRGQEEKEDRGGRPPTKAPGYKKKNREEKKPQAVQLRKQGLGYRRIAGLLNEAITTVKRWVK